MYRWFLAVVTWSDVILVMVAEERETKMGGDVVKREEWDHAIDENEGCVVSKGTNETTRRVKKVEVIATCMWLF
jgi:hypothetical protein